MNQCSRCGQTHMGFTGDKRLCDACAGEIKERAKAQANEPKPAPYPWCRYKAECIPRGRCVAAINCGD